MDITYYGNGSFVLKADRVVAIDPVRAENGADITLHSARRGDGKLVVDGPGEYEIGGVLVVTLEKGTNGARTLTHAVEVGGLNVMYLADAKAELSETDLLAMGKVDVLLVAAEDVKAAQEAAQEVMPRVVVPFGAKAAEVCASLGVKEPQAQSRLSWNGSGTAPKAVLLKQIGTRKRAA